MEQNQNTKIGYKIIFTQKEYLKMILSNFINRFGDSIDEIAFTWLVYQISGSATWSAIMFGCNFIPTIFLQPFSGALVEKINKKRLMILCDLGRGFLVTLIAVFFLLKILNPWILLIITLLNSSLESLRVPAGMAIVPKLLEKDYYQFGLSLNNTLSTITQVIGLAVAGGIIGIFGVHTAILTDAVTFILSAIIIAFIKVKQEEIHKDKFNFNMHSYFETLKGGFKYMKQTKVIINICLLGAIINSIMVPYNSLVAPLINEVYKLGSEVLSILGIMLTVGMGLGSFLYPYISKKLSSKKIYILGFAFTCIYYVGLVEVKLLLSNKAIFYVVIAFLSFIFGLIISLLTSDLSVSFMKYVEEDYLARVGGIFNSLVCCSNPVMSFILSIATTFFSTPQVFISFAILGVAATIVLYAKGAFNQL